MQHETADALIVGAGLAGLATALSVTNRRVTILCPTLPPEATGSSCAQGGIAAAVGAGDSIESHVLDTLQTGAGLCDARKVRTLCESAPAAIRWLEHLGVQFAREQGAYALHREGGHRRARVLHVDGDRSGQALTAQLLAAARASSHIEFRTGYTAVSLLTDGDGVSGVLACDERSRSLALRARDTVIATGGLGQLFERTTNPRSACGDGLAMALLAGAHCVRLEFVQFHPTALATDRDPLPLISEAVRGAGAMLVNESGERFMLEVHPDAELAPRDVVSRAVWRCLREGHRVYLDARAVLQKDSSTFPALRALCAFEGIDSLRERLPIVPAAHYHMGGIAVDGDGRSSLPNLWSCGEAACTGVHGANRLASNSLLEAVVFGRRLGAALGARRKATSYRQRATAGRTAGSMQPSLQVDEHVWAAVRCTVGNSLGVGRSASTLLAGREELALLLRNVPLRQALLRNRIRLAIAMLSAALARGTSIGAHSRVDEAVVTRAVLSRVSGYASMMQ